MMELRTGTKIWLAAGVTDMRRGVRHEAVSTIVQTWIHHEVNLRFRPQ
ncbi:MAG: hypothetical protein ABSD67_27050 [Terracidiphilus sp.]